MAKFRERAIKYTKYGRSLEDDESEGSDIECKDQRLKTKSEIREKKLEERRV